VSQSPASETEFVVLLDVLLDDAAAEELACDEDEAVLVFSAEGVEKTPDISRSAITATTMTVPAM
jgi:hypothetical protein